MKRMNDTEEYDITGLTGTLNLNGLAKQNPIAYGRLMYQAGIISEHIMKSLRLHILSDNSFKSIENNIDAINAIILENYSIINPMVTSDGLLMVMKMMSHIKSDSRVNDVIDYLRGQHTDDDMIAFIMYFSIVNGFSDSDATSITNACTDEINGILIHYDSRCPFIRGFNKDYDDIHVNIMLRMNELLKQGYPIEYVIQDAAIQREKELRKLIRKLRRIEKDARNKHDTDFFKPIYNQQRTVMNTLN